MKCDEGGTAQCVGHLRVLDKGDAERCVVGAKRMSGTFGPRDAFFLAFAKVRVDDVVAVRNRPTVKATHFDLVQLARWEVVAE